MGAGTRFIRAGRFKGQWLGYIDNSKARVAGMQIKKKRGVWRSWGPLWREVVSKCVHFIKKSGSRELRSNCYSVLCGCLSVTYTGANERLLTSTVSRRLTGTCSNGRQLLIFLLNLLWSGANFIPFCSTNFFWCSACHSCFEWAPLVLLSLYESIGWGYILVGTALNKGKSEVISCEMSSSVAHYRFIWGLLLVSCIVFYVTVILCIGLFLRIE